MAIDLNALREKYEKLNGNNNSGGNDFFQIPEGTSYVRILPGSLDEDSDKEFFAETRIHRVPDAEGKITNYHCRRVHNEPCPLCDAYYAIWEMVNKVGKDSEQGKELAAEARKIKPGSRYYMNVLDRESGEVKILSVGVILYKKIIGSILDPDFGDITDVNSGHDFKISKMMEAGSPWPKYDQSQPRPKSTPLGNKKEIAEIMDQLHDIHGLVKLEDYESVRNAAQAFTGGDDAVSSGQQEEPTEVSDADFEAKMKS